MVLIYLANCVSWVPRLTLLDLQAIGHDALSEQNSFVCRGLTILHCLRN